MAFTFPTSTATIESFAAALYGYGLGSSTLSSVQNDAITNGLGGNGLNTTLNNYYSASFGAVSTAIVAKSIVANIGLGTDANAIAYVTGQLNAAPPSARGAAVVSILNALSALTADATYGAAATAWTNTVSSLVTYGQTTQSDAVLATAVKAGSDALTFAASAGKNYDLTTGVNSFTGTDGNDTFTAGNGTFTSLDKLDGGKGVDTLNITSTAAFTTPTGAATTNIENINLTSVNGAVFDTSANYLGVNTLTVANSIGAVTVNAAATQDATVTNAAPGAVSTVIGGNNVSLTVSGAIAGDDAIVGSVTSPSAGTASVNYTGSATTVGADLALGVITVTGGTSINISGTVTNKDAATFTNTASEGVITVTGSAKTTSVSVSQQASKAVQAVVAAAAGGNNAVTAVAGVGNGQVVIADLNSSSAIDPNTIDTVSLTNPGAGSTITTSALKSLTLISTGTDSTGANRAAGDVTITNNASIPSATSLALNISGRFTTLADANGEIATINATVPTAARIDTALTDAGLTTLNIAGAAQLRIDGNLPDKLKTISVTDSAGLRTSIVGTAVTAFDGTQTTGNNYIQLNSSTQTFAGGTGNDTVRISGDATKAISGGDGVDTLIVPAGTYTAAKVGANVTGFETLATVGAARETLDLSLFAGNKFTTIDSVGGAGITNTISNIAPGAAIIIETTLANGTVLAGVPTGDTGTHVLTSSDYSGFTDSATITLKGTGAIAGKGTMGTLTTALTLADANGTGFGTVNFITDATVAGGRDDITALTDTFLANLNISGTGSLTIGGLTTSSATLTIKDTDTSTGASGITLLTAGSLANLSYSGTHAFTTALAAGNTAKAVTISNANTGTSGVLTIGTTALNSATKITLTGSVAATLTSTVEAAQKLTAGTDNSNISFSNTAGTAVKTIVAGNGNNTITTGGGADVITLGNGANTVTPGAGGDTITFDASHIGVDALVYGAASETAQGVVTNGNVVISAATGYDVITGMHTGDTIDISALGTFTAGNTAVLTNYIAAADTNGDIAIIRGNYNTAVGFFTKSSTGTDTLIQWDSNGASANGSVETILLVGTVSSATAATAGVITL